MLVVNRKLRPSDLMDGVLKIPGVLPVTWVEIKNMGIIFKLEIGIDYLVINDKIESLVSSIYTNIKTGELIVNNDSQESNVKYECRFTYRENGESAMVIEYETPDNTPELIRVLGKKLEEERRARKEAEKELELLCTENEQLKARLENIKRTIAGI